MRYSLGDGDAVSRGGIGISAQYNARIKQGATPAQAQVRLGFVNQTAINTFTASPEYKAMQEAGQSFFQRHKLLILGGGAAALIALFVVSRRRKGTP